MEETENPLELGKVDANPDLESDTFSNDDISIEGKEVYWTTGQVGYALGISSDMARIHINNFAEYFELKFSKPGKNGRLYFPSESIDLLKKIVNLRKTKSIDEVKEILDNPDLSGLFGKSQDFEQHLAMMFSKSNQMLMEQLEKIIQQHLKPDNQLLEDNKALIDQNNKLQKKINALQSSYDMLQNTSIKNEQLLQDLTKSNEELKEKIIESLDKPKKKGFFSFFK